MGALNFTKQDLKRLILLLATIVVVGTALAVFVIKAGLLDKLAVVAQDNIILTMCILIPFTLNILTLFFYGLSISLLPTVIDGVIYNKIFGLFPIYNGIKMSNCYYESELRGILGTLPIIGDVIVFGFYVIGLIYLYIVDGFFIISPAIIKWAIILFILFFINNMIKSFVMGKVAASFDDLVPTRFVAKLYLVPLIGGLIVAFYYIVTTALIFFGVSNVVIMKSTLINIITLAVPFFSPIYTCFAVRGIIQDVYNLNFKQDY